MDVRAAVAFAPGKPLEVTTVQLDGPRADEVLVFKCWASASDGRARYTAHTGFKHPTAPPSALPRESIEVRTVVVDADRRRLS